MRIGNNQLEMAAVAPPMVATIPAIFIAAIVAINGIFWKRVRALAGRICNVQTSNAVQIDATALNPGCRCYPFVTPARLART
jgi:hypothetical protein